MPKTNSLNDALRASAKGILCRTAGRTGVLRRVAR